MAMIKSIEFPFAEHPSKIIVSGMLTIVADFMGAIGSGTGIL